MKGASNCNCISSSNELVHPVHTSIPQSSVSLSEVSRRPLLSIGINPLSPEVAAPLLGEEEVEVVEVVVEVEVEVVELVVEFLLLG